MQIAKARKEPCLPIQKIQARSLPAKRHNRARAAKDTADSAAPRLLRPRSAGHRMTARLEAGIAPPPAQRPTLATRDARTGTRGTSQRMPIALRERSARRSGPPMVTEARERSARRPKIGRRAPPTVTALLEETAKGGPFSLTVLTVRLRPSVLLTVTAFEPSVPLAPSASLEETAKGGPFSLTVLIARSAQSVRPTTSGLRDVTSRNELLDVTMKIARPAATPRSILREKKKRRSPTSTTSYLSDSKHPSSQLVKSKA
jgi:hypothetical protein